jgi:hypothetical protein
MMHDLSTDRSPSRLRLVGWAALGMVLLSAAVSVCRFFSPVPPPPQAAAPSLNSPREANAEQVHRFCGVACHAYPPPNTFPRSAWRREVKQAYDLFRDSKLSFPDFPSQESVVLYFERRAPQELPQPKFDKAAPPWPKPWRRKDYRLPGEASVPAVSHVNVAHLFDRRWLDILVCEMRRGQILALQAYLPEPTWHVLYSKGPDQGFNPAHAEVVDLDGDGIQDVIVANLGYTGVTDAPCGSVLWLRGLGEGRFEPHTLLDGVGRVADVQTADFRGRGKLDLVVASFGWRNRGGIYYLENHTLDGKKPHFEPRVLDERHGTVRVPIGDLNGDGKADFVAVISQEHETLVAFINEDGRFRKETLYTAPHPAYGSSGAELVDVNGDGKLDMLYSNGDTLDPPYLLKPYHGVQWLENRGAFPFVHHPLTSMYGAVNAVAVDFAGKGKKDIAVVSFLSSDRFPQREPGRLDSLILLEQTAPGQFVRHSLETVSCDHFTCASGDIYGDGKPRLLTGSFSFLENAKLSQAVTVWEQGEEKREVKGTK